jgi:AcrB/AcrD/AcrF family
MRLAHFFIERPRFAIVLSTFVTLLGLGALLVLPVAQYPEIVPPSKRERSHRTSTSPARLTAHAAAAGVGPRSWAPTVSRTESA